MVATNENNSFAGKVAFVTGAASGIGHAAALAFAREGARVVVADVSEHGNQETARMVEDLGGQALAVQCDVTQAADVQAALDQAIATFGRLDVAFNNAGVEQQTKPAADLTEQEWDRIIAINLRGVFLCMKYEVPLMLQHGGGAIVNTSSGAGVIGFAGAAAYVAAKHGVVGLTKSAALDYAQAGIRINAVCPGIIDTAMMQRVTGDTAEGRDGVIAQEPVGRMGTPEEIAAAVLWLCSDAASFVIGQAIVVDGGQTAGLRQPDQPIHPSVRSSAGAGSRLWTGKASLMSTTDFPGVRWHGHWVAPDVPQFVIDPTSVGSDLPPAGFSRAQFRRVFELQDVPARVPLRLSADSRYVLWVNGAEVGRGPIRSQPRRLRYDEYDIATHLRSGRNVVAVLVTYYGHPNSFWQPAASSGVMGRDTQLVLEARVGDQWLVTDQRWRVLRSGAWRAPPPGKALEGVPIELLDARELDPYWREPDFDDSSWVEATVQKASHDGALAESRPPVDPYGAMLPRGIGMLGGSRVVAPSVIVQTAPTVADLPDHPADRLVRQLREAGERRAAQLPLTVARNEDAVTLLTVNFGRIVAGHVELEVDAPPGVRLDMFYQESADYDAVAGPVASAPRSSASYTTRGFADRYKAVDINGLRQIFLMIPPGADEVTVRDIAVSEYHYPFAGGAAFTCSDPELDRLYRAGIRTTEMNSFDAFTDCPTREQRAWVGDGVVHQMVHLVANEDWRLARNYLTLGASPRADGMLPMSVAGEIEYRAGYTIPDWALHWVHGVWNLFRHDDDRSATLRLLPVVERVLRWYEPYIDEHGTLSDVPEWNLIDWSSVFSSGRSSLITGLWARGLAEYAEMADWLGNTASAAWARGLWEQARHGYEDFWDAARGSYVDHIVAGERMPAMSQAAGAVAIVSGLTPQDRWAGIVDVITDTDRLVVRSWIGGEDGGYDMTKIVEQSQGIYRIDWDVDREVVLAEPFFSYVVHDAVAAAGRADRLPGLLRRWSVFLHDGFDTFGECWGWGTPVHAWSATPTKDLVWYVLGVTPAEPGYGTVRVAPRPGAIERMAGAVPTPHGLVRVEVEHGQVRVDSPVPVRFVSLSGDESSASAGRSEFTL